LESRISCWRTTVNNRRAALDLDLHAMLQVAIEEARQALAEGGIPIGGALFDTQGQLLWRGHNPPVQHNDPSAPCEPGDFSIAGRPRNYSGKFVVMTLVSRWYCNGLRRQFRIGTVIIEESN